MKPAVPLLSAGFVAGLVFGAGAMGGLTMMSEPAPQVAEQAIPQHSAETSSDPASSGRALLVETPPDAVQGDVMESGLPRATAEVDPEAMGRLQSQLADLQVRLASVEQTLDRVLSASTRGASTADPERPLAPRTQDERRVALVAAGVDPGLAEDLMFREAQRSLERLSLRDQATREGWIGTEQYREELGRLNADARSLREEIGDGIYDRYLYATGEDNRVAVASVIPGSAAEAAGLQAGDLIESYADERLFRYSELRRKTTEGEYGELVPVRVRRGTSLIEAWIPRGPLGVTLDSARVEPLP
jgi:hypothetical protein